MRNKIDPLCSFQLLGQACLGAFIGFLVAICMAGLTLPVGGHPQIMPEHLLSWNLHNVLFKPREKGFYLLSLLFGPIGAYVMTTRLWVLNSRFIWLFLLASIPLANFVAGHVLQQDNQLSLLFFMIIFTIALAFFASRNAEEYISTATASSNHHFSWAPYLILLLILTVVLIPRSFTEVAARIGMEVHVAGTLIGPALYFLKGNLLPGIDYYTQYSIGQPWLFSHILGNSAEVAIRHYTILVIITTWLFFSQILLLMRWLYQSWVAATIVTFTFLIMLFHGENHFFDPSSSVLRYPLLGICAWLFARWSERPDSMARHIILALAIALSLFLNTETGIITAATVTLVSLMLRRPFFSTLLQVMSLGLISLFFILLLVLLVFGPRAFQLDFIRHMLEPILLFGKYGFGGWPLSWSLRELNWFYNLVSPGIVVASLAIIVRSRNSGINPSRLAALAFFAIAGLFMMAKFLNMSIMGLWEMNALGFLVILVWWGKTLAAKYENKVLNFPFYQSSIHGHVAAWMLVILSAFYLVAFANDSRNPCTLGLRSWVHYPSLASTLFHKRNKCRNFSCVTDRPSVKDIALIQERTKPGEQVAIIDLYDWTYLVGAHRPPLMLFTPAAITFTKQQLSESLNRVKSTRYLFLHKGTDLKEVVFSKEPLMSDFLLTFKDNYIVDGEGDKLVAWKRKDLP